MKHIIYPMESSILKKLRRNSHLIRHVTKQGCFEGPYDPMAFQFGVNQSKDKRAERVKTIKPLLCVLHVCCDLL